LEGEVSRRAPARPYAKALFDVALEEGRAEQVGKEVAAIARLVTEHEGLDRLLDDPAVPTKAKRDLVSHLAAEVEASSPLRKLLGLLADRDRLALLPRLNDAYQARLMQHQGIVEAHVTTAVPLPPDRVAAVVRGLEQATGKRIRLTAAVDPALIGGVRARLGSKVFDGSVARQLERLRERMVSKGL
jgi:F-type H+-transporting ATPase subunit delta